jgi:hypothetical protein
LATRTRAAEAVGVDLPAHVRVLVLCVALHARAVGACADEEPEVVVDAQEVGRHRDRAQVSVLEERREQLVPLEQVGRIGAAEERVEEPAVGLAVDLPGGGLVLRGLVQRVRLREIERDPDLSIGRERADHVHRPAVREQEMVRRGDGVGLARAPGGVLAPGVADPGVHPRLVVRDPVVDAVAQPSRHGLRVLGERLRGRAGGQPPASSSACGVSQWKSVANGSMSCASSSSTRRS